MLSAIDRWNAVFAHDFKQGGQNTAPLLALQWVITSIYHYLLKHQSSSCYSQEPSKRPAACVKHTFTCLPPTFTKLWQVI